HTSDPDNERIIDLRHPRFRADVQDFLSSGALEAIRATATSRILADAAHQFGYTVHLGWVDRIASDSDLVRCMVDAGPNGPVVEARYRGFRCRIAVNPDAPAAGIQRALGEHVLGDEIFDRRLSGAAMASVRDGLDGRAAYPERV
ncbi:MAG: hypothetical protein LC808_08500, partial [Actinobacteria bacterium]|nr:hypothetical protein [Actinomycetota bacterium]